MVLQLRNEQLVFNVVGFLSIWETFTWFMYSSSKIFFHLNAFLRFLLCFTIYLLFSELIAQVRNSTTILTREFIDALPSGWEDYAWRRINKGVLL